MTVLNLIRDCLDALLHPSARHNTLTRARHRAFIAPRLLGSLAALAAFPVYLAMRGAPSVIEVVAFAWLIAPILLSWFLSRTGHYEGAYVLSSLALASLIMIVAARTGGIESFAAIWLIVVPLEAALSASRRAVAFASALALACAGVLIVLGQFGCCHSPTSARICAVSAWPSASGLATLYAAGLAFGAESLARTSASLLNVEEDRYRLLARNMSDVISRHGRNGAVEFISPASETMLGIQVPRLLGTACSIAFTSPIGPLISQRCPTRRGAVKSVTSNSASGGTCPAASTGRIIRPTLSGSKCAAARWSRRPRQ